MLESAIFHAMVASKKRTLLLRSPKKEASKAPYERQDSEGYEEEEEAWNCTTCCSAMSLMIKINRLLHNWDCARQGIICLL